MMMNYSMMKIWKPLTRKNRNIVSLKNWMTMMMKKTTANMMSIRIRTPWILFRQLNSWGMERHRIPMILFLFPRLFPRQRRNHLRNIISLRRTLRYILLIPGMTPRMPLLIVWKVLISLTLLADIIRMKPMANTVWCSNRIIDQMRVLTLLRTFSPNTACRLIRLTPRFHISGSIEICSS